MELLKNKKAILSCLIVVLFTIFVLHAVYSTIDKRGSPALNSKKAVEQFRDIETTGKKWLNGYFGVFFRFKYLGNINWLIIPLSVYFFITIRKRERWQMALVFVWLLTALLIGIKGFDNYRYQFTLFPFTVFMILLLLWEFVKKKKKYVKILCFSFFTLICLYNVYHYFDVYRFFWDLRVSVKRPHFPSKLIDYLNTCKDIKKQSKVFVFNKPLFYYHTNKKGIDSRRNNAWKVNILFKNQDGRYRQKVFYLLKRGLKTRYVLLKSNDKIIYRTRMLTEFLNCECRLVLEDKGWFLYRLRDRPLENILSSPGLKKIEVWHPGKKLPRNISPSLKTQGIRGKFKFGVSREKKRGVSTLTIRSLESDEEGLRVMQFGYDNTRPRELDMKGLKERYIHFIVKAKISGNLINKNNYIFIQDFTNNWERGKHHFSSPYWRTYLISRRIREGSSKLMLGIRFAPKSSEDKILIKDIRIYISDNPL